MKSTQWEKRGSLYLLDTPCMTNPQKGGQMANISPRGWENGQTRTIVCYVKTLRSEGLRATLTSSSSRFLTLALMDTWGFDNCYSWGLSCTS